MSAADPRERYPRRVRELVERAPVVELLGGFQDAVHTRDGAPLTEHWLAGPGRLTDDDARFVRDSGIRVFALGELHPDRDAMRRELGRWNAFLDSNPAHLTRVVDGASLRAALAPGRIGVILSFQDSAHFETPDDVAAFHALGQRISQLTYNDANRIGCGAFVTEDRGLTAYGTEIVARMDATGMAIDVSHCGDRTTLDAIAASRRPVLVTHASCRALVPGYPRAKTDEAIRKVAAGGGLIGLPMLRFMVRGEEPVTIGHFLDHVDHLARVAGIEHVAIGSDQALVTEDDEPLEERRRRLERAPAAYRVHTDAEWRIGIEGLDHAWRTFDVADGLLGRGYSEADVEAVLGGNAVRVLTAIWDGAAPSG